MTVPAILGNVTLWKPSPMATYANYLTHKILLEAGVPGEVIQFVPVRPLLPSLAQLPVTDCPSALHLI